MSALLVNCLILGSFAVLSGGALLALAWAVKSGQFKKLQQGSQAIFDDKEPIGLRTDAFPQNEGYNTVEGEK